jgi:hypothetical protein
MVGRRLAPIGCHHQPWRQCITATFAVNLGSENATCLRTMPGTLQYRPTLIDELITQPRMSSYQRVFNPTNDIELMGAYLWNTHVCGAIYPLIGTAEVLTETDAIQHLLEKITKIEDLLALIHPENVHLLQKNGILHTAHRACSSDEIRRFQHLAHGQTVRSLEDLADLVHRSAINNAVLGAKLDAKVPKRFLVAPW